LAVRLGDIIEIKTSRGLSYAQYTHKHSQYGALLRVFEKAFAIRPTDFSQVVLLPVACVTVFPLGAACSRGIVTAVSNHPIQTPTEFPKFRAGVVDRAGKYNDWWLWGGKTDVHIGAPKPGQEELPIRGVINDTLSGAQTASRRPRQSASPCRFLAPCRPTTAKPCGTPR
jgi:hypothetical protein